MLCSRSASLTMITRISVAMASSILRTLSACRSSRGKADLAQLGNAVHAARHFLAEVLSNLIERDRSVLHQIVQQAGLEANHVHLHVRQNVRHRQRMRDILFARFAFLVFVRRSCEAVGPIECFQILFGPVPANLPFQAAKQLFCLRDIQHNRGHQ